MTIIPNDEFRLGLTMAGAITAGSYTGGVMDYMFEILDLWEKAKKGEIAEEYRHLIPQHKVIIDAMGGASAGGMTTIMGAIYALKGNIVPITNPNEVGGKRNNVFYDSWVLLNDDSNKLTSEKIWETDDLNDKVVRSFLNSKFIDTICNRAIDLQNPVPPDGGLPQQLTNLPPYVDKNLEMLISICTLRGIPFKINFTPPISRFGKTEFTTYDHFTLAHFKLNNGVQPTDDYLWLNPLDTQWHTALRKVAIATGAFPFGLRYRDFDYGTFTNKYLEETAKRIMLKGNPTARVDLDPLPPNFDFTSVDGGTVNNDPFGEILEVLETRYGKTQPNYKTQYGMIMIDPFPNFDDSGEYSPVKSLLDIPAKILGTLRQQATLKRSEVIDSFNGSHFTGMIYPKKWIAKGEEDPYPITCESVGAFGGILDINFRHHDFFLGRNNARNFFRYFFSLPYDGTDKNKQHPIHQGWTAEMVDAFKVVDEKTGQVFLPIIPDMHLLGKNADERFAERIHYDILDKPQYPASKLFALEPAMKNRLQNIVELLLDQLTNTGATPINHPITDELVNKQWGKNWFQKLIRPIGKFFTNIIVKKAVNNGVDEATKQAIKYVLKNLEERKLLKR